jgi:hypothetical protein
MLLIQFSYSLEKESNSNRGVSYMAQKKTAKEVGRKKNTDTLKVLVRDLEKSLDLQAAVATGGSKGGCSTYCACSAMPVPTRKP